MKLACALCGIAVILHPAAPAPAREVTLPDGIPISISGTNFAGEVASNAIDGSWLVVWTESFGTAGSEVRGRIVRADGTFSPDVLEISEPGGGSFPEVAHDPIRNEWMVVWGAEETAGDPARLVRARKVAEPSWVPRVS